MSYVPLWVKTNGSLLEGASHPEEIVDRAADLGIGTLAIADRDSMTGMVRAHVRAKERGLRVICGAQVTVGRDLASARRIVLLAQSREGYGRLCRLITLGQARMPKGQALVSAGELAEHSQDLIALAPDAETLGLCEEPFRGRLYALVTRHRRAAEVSTEISLRALAKRQNIELVAGIETLYHDPSRRFLADVLAAVRHKRTLDDAGRALRENAEHALASFAQLEQRFADLPHAIERTHEVAERCRFSLFDLRYRYPAEHLPHGETQETFLRALTHEGARARFPEGVSPAMQGQLERELALVEDLDYGGYFLTMWDIVRFCRENNILCQGRGSAANSSVCYCLGITAIDPVRMDLLFERFLSRERAEPPDIDLDIEHDRREEVIQYVYRRWGRRRAAMVANIVRYRAKSAVRDVGKALGLPATALDHASKLLSGWGEDIQPEALRDAGIDPSAPRAQWLLRLANEIQEFPRHLSIHPGGFLLGAEPVDTIVPVEPATMKDRTVIQWDKQDVEDLGLFKVDLLGLGMLTQIHHCFDLLKASDGLDLSIATVPADDRPTYEMIGRADTVGVFQIESRAQMSMLPRLKPRNFYDLVIEVAIVRPGPIQGDMVHPYLRRRDGLEEVSYPHPSLERVLKKTMGVPIFQEQVMKLAVEAAGYSPGEADQLRRDMAAWRSRGRIEEHRERLVGRMVDRGIPLEFAERVFSQIRGFGEYGFPESHAASFALLSYVTAWLKCHYPAHFACALLNAWPMGFYQPSTIVEDAKRHGVIMKPIDVSQSEWDCTMDGGTVRMGLRYVKGLGEREKEKLLVPRAPGRDLSDFVRATDLGKKALLALARAGAFECFGLDRRRALWAVRGLLAEVRGGLALASDEPVESLPRFRQLTSGVEVSWDYRESLHSTRGHPMAGLRAELTRRKLPQASDVGQMRNGRRVTFVGHVICRQRPNTATGVTFMTLEDESGFVNLVVWRDVFARFAIVAKTAVLLEVHGRIQSEHGVVHLVAETLAIPDLRSGDGPRSRDFH